MGMALSAKRHRLKSEPGEQPFPEDLGDVLCPPDDDGDGREGAPRAFSAILSLKEYQVRAQMGLSPGEYRASLGYAA